MEDLPNLFNNLDQISAIHVALLSQIDQNQKKCAKNVILLRYCQQTMY